MGNLADQVALVTGAGQGAGMGIAQALAAEGAAVAVVGRTESKLKDVAAAIEQDGGTATSIQCDVADAPAIARAVDQTVRAFGTVNVLVNVAHHNVRRGLLLDMDEHDIGLNWTTGPLASLRFMRACHPYLSGDGVIIN